MIRISVWTWRRWGRDGAACKPPSPTGPGFQLARPRGRKEAGNSLAVRSRSCWHRAPCESPAWYHKAPWSWWSSYSKWIWGSGVYCLYFPLFDPQVHGDLSPQVSRFSQTRLRLWGAWEDQTGRKKNKEKKKNKTCGLCTTAITSDQFQWIKKKKRREYVTCNKKWHRSETTTRATTEKKKKQPNNNNREYKKTRKIFFTWRIMRRK